MTLLRSCWLLVEPAVGVSANAGTAPARPSAISAATLHGVRRSDGWRDLAWARVMLGSSRAARRRRLHASKLVGRTRLHVRLVGGAVVERIHRPREVGTQLEA